MLELIKPILKAITAAVATFVAGWAAQTLGAEIDAVSLGAILQALVVGLVTWAVPNLKGEVDFSDTSTVSEIEG